MKPTKVNILDYQKIVESYHGESDRAAALLAGSFVEHYLAEYLKTCCLVSDRDIDELFHGFGPMATFARTTLTVVSTGLATGLPQCGQTCDLRIQHPNGFSQLANPPRVIYEARLFGARQVLRLIAVCREKHATGRINVRCLTNLRRS